MPDELDTGDGKSHPDEHGEAEAEQEFYKGQLDILKDTVMKLLDLGRELNHVVNADEAISKFHELWTSLTK